MAKLGIDVAHRVDHRLDDVHERRLAPAEQPGVAHRAAQDAAQHVAAALVGRKHAVREEKRHGARVVGEHAERRRVDGVRHDVGAARAPSDPHSVRCSSLSRPQYAKPTVSSTVAMSGAKTSVW